MLVQTLMLFSTRHIFCSEIPCESDHLQCCPNMCPFREKRRTRGILINAVNVPAGGWGEEGGTLVLRQELALHLSEGDVSYKKRAFE